MRATVTMTLRYAGFCRHPHGMVVRRAPWRPVSFPAVFATLDHAREGITLFDTGYTSRFAAETRPFPARLYRWLTPVTLNEGGSAAAQLAARGIEPSSVRRIVLSHFHAAHIAGARDFPNARFIATEEAYRAVPHPGAIGRLRRGFLPGLLPDDFEARAQLLRPDDFQAKGLPAFGPAHDLFGDGSVRLVRLPGHAAGQVGALVNGPDDRRHFLIADAAWTTDSFREDRPAYPAAGLIMDEARVAAQTLSALHALSKEDPTLDIVPSHCPVRAESETRLQDDGRANPR